MNISDKMNHQSTFTDAELIAVSEGISSYFPRPISDTLITLMEVDPYTIHAYWNIEPSRMESALDALGGQGSLTLRVHTIQSGTQNSGDLFSCCEIQGMQSSAYLMVKPLTSYVADIGLLPPDGDFFVLARSNEVITPPDYHASQGSTDDTTLPQATALLNSDELLDETGPLSVSSAATHPLGAFYTLGENPKERCEAHVEIRVFGRVNPSAGLTIAGERVSIRPDGSFNHRIPLKDKKKLMSRLKVKLS